MSYAIVLQLDVISLYSNQKFEKCLVPERTEILYVQHERRARNRIYSMLGKHIVVVGKAMFS